MPKYEVGIYNQKVRDSVAEGEHHRQLDDKWAEIHYFEIDAPSEEVARRKISASHSPHLGYVIDNIDEVQDKFD